MSAQGKHRRVQLSHLTRIAVATGVLGATFALPVAAASAHQGHAAASVPQAAPAAVTTIATETAPAATAVTPVAAATPAASSYQVVSGDTLSKIASAKQVDGGWEKLYQDNRTVVGGNPNLIYPGQQLSLAGKAVAATPAPAAEAPKAVVEAPKTETKSSSSSSASTTDSTKASRSKATTAAPKASTAPKAAAAPKAESAAVAAGGYVAPVSGGTSTAYHASGSSWSSGYHTGVDFRASTGTSVKAITSGTVVKAGNGGSYGNEVVVKHADGKYSEYAHLSSISVSVGQSVSAGQQLGLSGATGNVTGPHLHFEVRTGPAYGSDIDPVAYLRAHGVNV
ncbi:murein DD-endopeptidase MepM/ murein hydrolase activator NlpD [Kitasatospora gansuensis]|uniref:Murein DD-endopeptidase MepM/ murein hydrolase activator NlpD n=1 Tax=Kitasatospora gansuensis TaxID=258050 RepID=A0A7W7WK34_9ACTN|nr:peptidoglycan DD-metalloendopeptidase family protein [Kitasatospora gansuensis]MBB4949274.1 murein DD-endopeptidase MepM/ murein hydrolase activator NlpD [Kitasatospora gansuensis]